MMAQRTNSRPLSPTPSKLPPIPGSPSYSYASTANPISAYNLPLPPPPPQHRAAVLTKNDLEQSQNAYSDLLSTAKTYRLALASLSKAASGFGSALEACARLKEARSETLHSSGGSLSNSFTAQGSCTADNLMAASGVHQLIANHQQILSETVYRSFEVPLLHELDAWRRHMEEEEVAYLKEVKARSHEIRKMEIEGLKLHKQRKRDVARFRGHLVDLTTKLDGLTTLHGGHSRGLLGDSQRTSIKIVEAASSLVRAEVDIFESLARKGWSGGGLDELLDKGTDLFANDADTHTGDTAQLFSILPQKSILPEAVQGEAATSKQERPPPGRRTESLLDGDEGRYQSLAGAVTNEEDTRSIFSTTTPGENHFNISRGVRPFSPPPVGVNRLSIHEDEFGGLLNERNDEEEPSSPWGDIDGEQAEEHKMATNETVQESGNRLESSKDGAVDEESDVDDAATMTPALSDAQRAKPGRRWSVTDDDVVSE